MSAVDEIVGDYAAATTVAAFVRRPTPGLLALSGDDAGEFLQGQVTNDIESLQPGAGRYAALLTPKGKMRADMRVLRTAETLLVLTDASQLPTVRHTIDTFRIGYFFTTDDRSEHTALLSLLGPSAAEKLASIADVQLADAENANAQLTINGHDMLAIRTLCGVDLLGATAAIDAAAAALTGAGVEETTGEVAEILRVEHGIPAFGSELDENTIPGEAGLNERAVNFEKGCYVGQETVARMHYKGKPNRILRGLKGKSAMTPGATITATDGKDLGMLGSAVVSPTYGPIGLSVLRREAEPGAVVDVGGVEATVLDIDSFPN